MPYTESVMSTKLEAIPGIEGRLLVEGIWDAGIASSQLPDECPLA
jgi:hypothetical protein